MLRSFIFKLHGFFVHSGTFLSLHMHRRPPKVLHTKNIILLWSLCRLQGYFFFFSQWSISLFPTDRDHVELTLLVPSTLILDNSKTKTFTYNSMMAEVLIRKPSIFSTVLSLSPRSLQSASGRCSSPLHPTGEGCNSPCPQSPPIQSQDHQHLPFWHHL